MSGKYNFSISYGKKVVSEGKKISYTTMIQKGKMNYFRKKKENRKNDVFQKKRYRIDTELDKMQCDKDDLAFMDKFDNHKWSDFL